MDCRFSLVTDRFDDTLGIILLASEIKGFAQFMERFGVTERELEVIHFLKRGLTYEKIARRLEISRRTVKAHIGHIYNKLGIDNRIQLVDLLKKYDLF
jgi:DNA-binding NarL/FixJ family response regulator